MHFGLLNGDVFFFSLNFTGMSESVYNQLRMLNKNHLVLIVIQSYSLLLMRGFQFIGNINGLNLIST